MKSLEVRVIIFPQGDLYVAQGLEYDIVAQGTERAEVEKAFTFSLAGHYQTSIERGEEPMEGVPEAPMKFFRMWDRAKISNRPAKQRFQMPKIGTRARQTSVANFAFA